MTACVGCGAEATGLRCRACNIKEQRRLSLAESAARDRDLIASVESEGLNSTRLANRLGVSRVAAARRIRDARRREQERAEALEAASVGDVVPSLGGDGESEVVSAWTRA